MAPPGDVVHIATQPLVITGKVLSTPLAGVHPQKVVRGKVVINVTDKRTRKGFWLLLAGKDILLAGLAISGR